MGLLLEGREEEIQELLDAGYSYNKMAQITGISDKTIKKIVVRKGLEIYTAFDEEQDQRQLVMNFEWLYEEDRLEEIFQSALEKEVVLPKKEERNDDWNVLSRYIKDKYKNIIEYARVKDILPALDFVFMQCAHCDKLVSLNNFHLHHSAFFGLDSRCTDCCNVQSLNWAKDHPEELRLIFHRRDAKRKNLPNDFSDEDLSMTSEKFENKCALSGIGGKYHLDHVIPLAVGHGGMTYGNIIPLRGDLNCSKNDSNIFEWFDANRQRFELSQERFDNLIEWLAPENALTVEEYRNFYDWCHANPRTIDEIKADQRHSIEIWREASGQQFPLPAYTEAYTSASTSEIEAIS